MICNNCGIEFEGKQTAKYCSDKCRVTASRKKSVTANCVTANVTVKEPTVTENFEYTIKTSSRDKKSGMLEIKNKKRIGKYWYDIPLCAIPIIKKGWPQMPEYMNGRQYFLWWKNKFETGDKGPILENPFPKYDKLDYIQAGDNSRRWGA